MKLLIGIFSCLLLAVSCNNRDDFFESLNDTPELELVTVSGEMANEVTDSLKMSGDFGLYFYEVKVVVSDINENIEELKLNEPFLPGLYIQSDSILVDVELVNVTRGEKDSLDLKIAVFQEGRQDIVFTLVDSFDKTAEARLSINVFNNLIPIVEFDAEESELNDMVWEIDLSQSFDNDQNFGGQIISYTVIVEGQVRTKSSPLFRHTFSQEGSYPVSVYVTDNNEQQSFVKFFSIEL